MRTPEELTTLFRGTGRKVTPQRQRIFRALDNNLRHPTAEGVYGDIVVDMPTVSLRTVYQTLAELTELGEINKTDLGTGSARFDPNVEPHHHLVCDDCGAIRDVTANTTEVRVPSHQRGGFRVEETEVVFRGRCRDCLSKSSTGE